MTTSHSPKLPAPGSIAPAGLGYGVSRGGRVAQQQLARRASRALGTIRSNLDPLRVALLLLTLLTISRIHQHIGVLGRIRPALLLAGFAFVYAFLRPRLLGQRWIRTWPAKVLVGLAIMACLSAPFGISLGASAVFILSIFSKVLIFAFLLMAVLRSVRDLSMFVWAYVISCGILVWMSTLVFGLSTAGAVSLARLSKLYMYDANDLGLMLVIGVALSVLTFQTSGRAGKLISGITLVGIGIGMARSGSRGGFLGLVVVGLALLFALKNVSVAKRVGFVLATFVALLIASPQGYWDQIRTMTNPTEDYNWQSETGRKALIERGLGYMKRYPIFGIGIGNFERAEGTLAQRAADWQPGMPGIRWSAPHNSFLEVGTELGIPGLILWSSLLFGGIVGMRRLRRRLPRAWARGDPEERFLYSCTIFLPVALLGFAVTSFFVSFAFLDPIYFLAALMTGVYVSVDRRMTEMAGASVTTSRSSRRGRHPHVRLAQSR